MAAILDVLHAKHAELFFCRAGRDGAPSLARRTVAEGRHGRLPAGSTLNVASLSADEIRARVRSDVRAWWRPHASRPSRTSDAVQAVRYRGAARSVRRGSGTWSCGRRPGLVVPWGDRRDGVMSDAPVEHRGARRHRRDRPRAPRPDRPPPPPEPRARDPGGAPPPPRPSALATAGAEMSTDPVAAGHSASRRSRVVRHPWTVGRAPRRAV